MSHYFFYYIQIPTCLTFFYELTPLTYVNLPVLTLPHSLGTSSYSLIHLYVCLDIQPSEPIKAAQPITHLAATVALLVVAVLALAIEELLVGVALAAVVGVGHCCLWGVGGGWGYKECCILVNQEMGLTVLGND